MEIYKDPISLFKQTNFSNTIWWKLKVNISAYQNETENKLVTEIFKNRSFRVLYPNIHKRNYKPTRLSAIGYGEYKPIAANDLWASV